MKMMAAITTIAPTTAPATIPPIGTDEDGDEDGDEVKVGEAVTMTTGFFISDKATSLGVNRGWSQ